MNKVLFIITVIFTVLSCNNEPQINIPEIERNIIFFNGLAETLSIIELPENRVFNNIKTTGMWPNHLTRDEEIILVNSGDNSISLYDDKSLNLIKEIYLGSGKNPWMSFPVPETDFIFVTCYISDEVLKVNSSTDEVIKIIDVGKNPEGGCIINNRLYIGNTNSDSISVINILNDEVENTINLSDMISKSDLNPQSIIPFQEKSEIHVICTGINNREGSDGIVIVIDSDTFELKTIIEVGGSPIYSEGNINVDKKLVYLHGTSGITVYNYDTYKKVESTTEFDDIFLSGLVYVPTLDKLYASDFGNDKIYIINGENYSNEKTLQASDGVQQLLYIKE